LFSPAVAPRDVAWILPFLCFYRNSGWLLLGAGVLLSYATPVVELQTGVRVELLEVKLLEYVPAFVLMGWSAIASYAVPAVAHEIRRGQR
jgi:hypothetical protein